MTTFRRISLPPSSWYSVTSLFWYFKDLHVLFPFKDLHVLFPFSSSRKQNGQPRIKILSRSHTNLIFKVFGRLREHKPCYVGPCHHGMTRPQVADGGDGLQIRKVAVNILTKQSRTDDSGWSSNLGVGRGAYNSSP